MSLAEAFHTAQEAALRASGALAALVGKKILTVVPQGQTLPFVVIGEDQVLEDVEGCAGEGEVFSTVHVWSKPNPPQAESARAIGAAVIDALRAELTLTGFDVDLFELTSERYVTDADQSTHGIIDLHYLTTEQAGS